MKRLLALALLLALPGAAGPDVTSQRSIEDASLRQLPAAPRAAAPSFGPLAIGIRAAPVKPAGDRNPSPASHAEGEVGTALVGGYATWFDVGPGLYAAAGPLLREAFGPGWRGTVVEVAGPAGAIVRVRLVDACACGERHGMPTVLDLSADAFSELAPLSWGIVAVSVELVPVLPATDWREP